MLIGLSFQCAFRQFIPGVRPAFYNVWIVRNVVSDGIRNEDQLGQPVCLH